MGQPPALPLPQVTSCLRWTLPGSLPGSRRLGAGHCLGRGCCFCVSRPPPVPVGPPPAQGGRPCLRPGGRKGTDEGPCRTRVAGGQTACGTGESLLKPLCPAQNVCASVRLYQGLFVLVHMFISQSLCLFLSVCVCLCVSVCVRVCLCVYACVCI